MGTFSVVFKHMQTWKWQEWVTTEKASAVFYWKEKKLYRGDCSIKPQEPHKTHFNNG